VRIGFDRAKIVDRDYLDIGIFCFKKGTQNTAANTPKSIDGELYCHKGFLLRVRDELFTPTVARTAMWH
jgi:hypothetical protein